MAQYHYVVKFDSNTKKWSVDYDMTDNFDGHIWDDDIGFFYADDNILPGSQLIDERCCNMLDSLVSIWPAVDTELM